MVLVELVDDEPGGDGARVGVHVEDEERPAHGQNLDDEQRAQSPEVVVQSDQLVPVLGGQFLLGFLPQLHVH